MFLSVATVKNKEIKLALWQMQFNDYKRFPEVTDLISHQLPIKSLPSPSDTEENVNSCCSSSPCIP